MNILVIGNPQSFEELKLKLGNEISFEHQMNIESVNDLSKYDVIFDFDISDFPENFEYYADLDDTIVLLNTVKISLVELSFTFGKSSADIYGFNGLPTFINRETIEISSTSNVVSEKFKSLNWDYVLVDDRVGLVTPRIIFMIINEAFYTVQEGTASKEDINVGMKLGTNYPFGPFEWVERIGIKDIYETLEAVFEDTKDERYKIAPMLKKEYLNSIN